MRTFGNTPPVHILPRRSVPHTDISVLCLACADIRSCLFSLSRDQLFIGADIRIAFTVNDMQPTIIARNLVMIYMLANRVPGETILSFWLCVWLSADDYRYLLDAIHAFTAPGSEEVLHQLGVSFRYQHEWAIIMDLVSHWRRW